MLRLTFVDRHALFLQQAKGLASTTIMLIGLIATLLASPVLKEFGYAGVLGASIAATDMAAIMARTLPDRKRQEKVEGESYSQILRQAAREVAHNAKLLQIIGFGILLATFFGVMDEYASLFLHAAGVQDYFIPIVSAAMFLPSIVVGLYAHVFEKLQSFVFVVMVFGAGTSLVLAGYFLGVKGIIGFAAFLLLIKLAEIVYGAKLQHAITGRTRSTVTSINAFGVEVVSIGAYLLYGAATNVGGTAGALELFGLGLVAAALILIVYGKVRTRRPLAV